MKPPARLYTWTYTGGSWCCKAPSLTVHVHRSSYRGDDDDRWHVSCYDVDYCDQPLQERNLERAKVEALKRVIRVLEDRLGDAKRMQGLT